MRSQSKTLVILSPGFAGNEAESNFMTSQLLLVKAFNQLYPEVKIIILAFYYPKIKAEYNWFGNRVISFSGRNKEKIFRLITWVKIWLKLRKIIRQNNVIGLLSFWSTECAVLGKFFGKVYRLKHYTWVLGQDAKKDNKYVSFYKPIPNSLIAISDAVANEFYKNHGIKPKHIIYNGIQKSLFTSQQNKRKIDVLGAGSLIPLKQYDVFIKIIHQLRSDFPSIQATICGGGPEMQNLITLVKELQMEKNIHFTGTIDHADTIILMQQAKVFLHTSIYEGFSTACLEALYAGAHVVSFCFPMQTPVKHWHVVKNETEISIKIKEILQSPDTTNEPVLVQTIEETAAEIMKLFL